MVLHGTDDAISPVQNAHALVALLPGARLHSWKVSGTAPTEDRRLNGDQDFDRVIRLNPLHCRSFGWERA